MAAQIRTVEARMAQIAEEAWGIATRAELLAAGITRAQIATRVRTGALIPEFPGVYRVSHRARCTEATYMAAVKACGADAALYGTAAGNHLYMLRGAPPPPQVVSPREKRIEGVRTKRSRSLIARDVIVWRGIPVTTPARTLVDLAAVLTEEALGRACHEAGFRHGTTPRDVDAVLARRPTSPGAAKLRRILHGDARITLSRLERAFITLLEAEGLPLPVTNRPAGGRRVDCRWPDHRVTVELDSYRFHNSRHSWEADRFRERQAYARGDQFRRYTWDDVTKRRRMVVREMRALLEAS
jgi:hypothetical protein